MIAGKWITADRRGAHGTFGPYAGQWADSGASAHPYTRRVSSSRADAARFLPAPGLIGVAAIAMLVLLVYVVLLGGTAAGVLNPVLRTVTAVAGAALIASCVALAPGRADFLDGAVVAGVALFAIAGALSRFPRQSFDAVLGALVLAGAFLLARRLMVHAGVRRAFVYVLIGLSVLFTVIFTAYWLGAYLRWGALAGWAVLPPLDLQLSGGPWGHRYDIALLLALVYPAWWLERPSRFRVVIAAVIGLVGLALVLITGSRTVWLALAAATAVIAIPQAVTSGAAILRHGSRRSWPSPSSASRSLSPASGPRSSAARSTWSRWTGGSRCGDRSSSCGGRTPSVVWDRARSRGPSS